MKHLKPARFSLARTGFSERFKAIRPGTCLVGHTTHHLILGRSIGTLSLTGNKLSGFCRVSLILLLFLFYLSNHVSAESLSLYPTCTDDRKNYTQRVVRQALAFNIHSSMNLKGETEGGCTTTNCVEKANEFVQEQAQFLLELSQQATRIPLKCFLASVFRGAGVFEDYQYSYCIDEKGKAPTGTKIHCVDENYLQMVSKVFSEMSYCFNLTRDEKESFFSLINHESGFALNARSGNNEGARCFGQLTPIYIEEILDKVKNVPSHYYTQIQGKAIKRCPGLKKQLLSGFEFGDIDCPLTHNPYTCLFYTFLGLKRNRREMTDFLKSSHGYRTKQRGEFSKVKRKKFKLPIRVNEMLVVSGNLRGSEKSLVYWSDFELYNSIGGSKYTDEEIQALDVRKVPLFQNEESVIEAFSYWGHVGGPTMVGSTGKSMIENLKKDIANSTGCQEKPTMSRCQLRDQIKIGRGLSARYWLPYLSNQVLINYPEQGNVEQTFNYVPKILGDERNTFGKENKYTYRKYLSHMSPLDQQKFLKSIRGDDCPKPSLWRTNAIGSTVGP